MTRSELVAKLVDEHPALTQTDADRIVRTLFATIAKQLASGGRVELRGFGVFSISERDARTGLNPRTGETVAIEAKAAVRFSAGKELRNRLNSE